MILIQVQGGCVANIFSDDPALAGKRVILQDFDTDGADPSDTVDLWSDGSPAFLGTLPVDPLGPETAELLRKWQKERETL